MAKRTSAYGLNNPLQDVFPVPVIAQRAPTANDINYELGQTWVNRLNNQIYGLANVAAGAATWSILGPGSSDVDTISGDSGGPLSPAGGNIALAGGTNLTTVGAGSTITTNMDAAITLATSVTSPLYTAGAGVPLALTVPVGQDGNIVLGDAAGANKLSIQTSAAAEIASIDSAGKGTFAALTAAGTVLLNDSNNANSSINTGTSTGTVSVGNALAGAVTVTSGGTIGLVGTTAVNASNNANTSINTGTSTGTVGIGNSLAGAVTVTSGSTIGLVGTTAVNASNNANTTINTGTSTGTVGIGNSLAGAVTITSSGTIGLVGTTAVNASNNANTAINTGTSTGTVGIGNSLAGAITVTSSSTIGLVGTTAINDSNNANSSINTGTSTGTVSVGNAAAGAITADTAAGISLDAATASNFTVTGAAADLTLSSSGGSVNVTATEAVSDAIVINASDAAGGVQLRAGTAGTQVFGNLLLSNVATQIQMNGGAVTDFIGQATLATGTVTVANTNIAAGDRIFLTRSALNGSTALGELVSVITPATNFVISSVSVADATTVIAGDASIVDYVIVRQF